MHGNKYFISIIILAGRNDFDQLNLCLNEYRNERFGMIFVSVLILNKMIIKDK